MIGVIPAAGNGTRLLPITKIVNKTLLLVYDKPVIYYAIDVLVNSGIKDIVIIVPTVHLNQFEKLLEDRDTMGIRNLHIKVCDHALGMPFSIRQAKELAGKKPIMVVPGDNIFLSYFAKDVSSFRDGALVCLRKVKDPSIFGVPVFKNRKIVSFIEKPKSPKSKYAVVAPYIFDSKVYDYIDSLKPSQRGELEIVDLLNIYLANSRLKIIKMNGFWKDIGTPDSLVEAGVFIKRLRRSNSRARQ